MSDPLSIAASLIAVLQLAAVVTGHLKSVKHGAEDRARLRDELRNAICLLEMLKDRVEDSDDLGDKALKPASLESLVAPDGPLDLFKRLLEDIAEKLAPRDSLGKLTQPFMWPFTKKDIVETLEALERLKLHFSLIIQNDLVILAQLSNTKLDGIDKKVDNLETKSQDAETEKILCWLSPMSFKQKHVDILETVQPGTCQWLLRSEIFTNWVNGDIDILWCPGIPGAGKTRLASLIIDHLETRTSSEGILGYVYCDYNQRTDQTPLNILSNLLRQVAGRAGGASLPPEVSALYDLHKGHDTRPTLAQISNVLRTATSQYKLFHVVIDALDECAESEELTINLLSQILSLGSHVRLLCTSRHSATFGSFFNTARKLEIAAHDEDVRSFLEAHIPQHSRLSKHVRADPKLKGEIIDVIITESQGMFLLARLHLESLSRKINRKEVRSSLNTLPRTLDTTYEQALLRIRSQAEEDIALAETILFWVLCARRPLTVLELQHLHAVRSLMDEDEQEEEGSRVALDEDDLPDGEILTGVCGGLVVVDGKSQTVRLVHYTAQQYLERTNQERLPGVKLDITKACLMYLMLENFVDGVCLDDASMSQRLEKFPFLQYASQHWGSEANDIDLDALWPYTEKFLLDKTAVEVASQVRSIRVPTIWYTSWSQDFPEGIPALVLAASFDMPEILRRLVARGHDLEGKGSDQETPLIRAASLGHDRNVAVLLELGAKTDAHDYAGETALEKGARNNHKAVVKVLLQGGADVNAHASDGWTVLMSTVLHGNADIVHMLIQGGADVSATTRWGESALTLAALNGQETIANYLVDSGAILPANAVGRRASIVASRKGLQRLVGRLTAAPAQGGLQRQQQMFPGIDETDDLTSDDENTLNLGEVLEGLEYSRGFHRRYQVVKSLHRTYFAEYVLCKSKATNVLYTAKCYTSKYTYIRNEITALIKLRHKNIVQLFDVVVQDDMKKLYVMTEVAGEGNLFDLVTGRSGGLTESETRIIFAQLFSALNCLHSGGWVHRDVKPENILFADKKPTIKLSDLSTIGNVRLEGYCNILCGTPSYIAPEVLAPEATRRYSYPVDVWSAGVVLYVCLCGFPPFSEELCRKEFPYSLPDQIRGAKFFYPSPYWDPVCDAALNLIDSMLVVDPENRSTIAECIEHPWMKMQDAG